MKVCLLNDSFPPVIDGVANTVMNYAQILTESGKGEVVVGTPRYPGGQYDSYPYRVVPYQSFDTSSLVHGYRAGNPMDMKEVDNLISFMPDIIHTHCPVASTIMARLIRNQLAFHKNRHVPLVFTYHTKFDVDIARAVKAQFLQKEAVRMLVNNISACDEVWVVSKGAGENLRSLGYEGSYRVVSNGVDFAKGRVEAEKVAEAVKDYDLPAGVPVYLFVGRLMKYKGLPLILEALAKLARSGRDFRMVFVGGGADAPALVEEAIALGLSVDARNTEGGNAPDAVVRTAVSDLPGKVIFTGAIHDRDVLRAWNTRADLFLFPSTYDTNGIVVREAAACGLGSVLIKDSCASEGITDGRNGFLIEETGESLAALLENLGDGIERMREVGQHAMDEIYISWEESVYAAADRYGELIEMMESGQLEKYKKETSDYILDGTAHLIDYTTRLFRLPFDLFEGMRENVFGGGLEALEKKAQSGAFYQRNLEQAEEEEVRAHLKRFKNWESMRVLSEKTKAGMRAVGHAAIREIKDGFALSDLFE